MKSISVFTFIVGAFFMLAVLSSYRDTELPPTTTAETVEGEDYILPQLIRAIDLNKGFDFAGESLPMDNFDVRERLDRELLVNSYWHSSTVLNIKIAYRYFPVIGKILKENNIPDDFKYLAVAESGLRNVTSPAKAKGYWQFMPRTAKEYGLEVNKEVDERLHIEKSTLAACKYIQKLKDKFGSWTLAAAAYNMGGYGLKKEMGLQLVDNYYDINLNSETARYVFRVVAIKEILQHPSDFGFQIGKKQLYQPLDNFNIVEVNTPIPSWGEFAQKHKISYRMLKVYNPWLMSSSLGNKNKEIYEIKVPIQ